MRLVRKLTLVAAMAVATIALAAPAALGQAEPLAHDQTPQLLAGSETEMLFCGNVTINPEHTVAAGGCRLHMTGANIRFIGHSTAGIETIASTCNMEFVARLDVNVEGFLTHVEMADGALGDCHRRPCGFAAVGDEGRPWAFYGSEVGAGAEQLTVLFCLRDPAGTEVHCEADIPLTQPVEHRYTLTTPATDSQCHGGTGELNGSWSVEGQIGPTGENQIEDQVEINHI